MPSLYPSLIAADPLHIGEVIRTLDPHCAGYHLDIMDGHFVPQIAMGPLMVNAIAAATTRHVWIHCMVDNALQLAQQLRLPPKSLVTFHIEKNNNIKKLVKVSQDNEWLVGLALSPKTPIEESFSFLDEMVDHILIMSVEPGFSGQLFLPSAVARVTLLAQYRAQHKLAFTIGIDGGINTNNVALLAQEGVDMFAVGSTLFMHKKDPVIALQQLQAIIRTPSV